MKNQYEHKKILLLDRLRREMNGAVVDSMKKYNGLQGLSSYGVSLPTIKDICAENEKDHEFAIYLFKSNVRELKLCAIFLDEPNKITDEQIDSWSAETNNEEILSNMAHLFAESDQADKFFNIWIESSSEKLQRLSLIMAGSSARNRRVLDGAKIKIEHNLDKCNFYTMNSFVYAITNIIAQCADWREPIFGVLRESQSDDHKELLLFLE